MKMLSQLTRQAMSRHRIASANAAAAFSAESFPVLPPVSVPSEPSISSPGVICRDASPQRSGAIYRQLMASHDRMRQRHIHT